MDVWEVQARWVYGLGFTQLSAAIGESEKEKLLMFRANLAELNAACGPGISFVVFQTLAEAVALASEHRQARRGWGLERISNRWSFDRPNQPRRFAERTTAGRLG